MAVISGWLTTEEEGAAGGEGEDKSGDNPRTKSTQMGQKTAGGQRATLICRRLPGKRGDSLSMCLCDIHSLIFYWEEDGGIVREEDAEDDGRGTGAENISFVSIRLKLTGRRREPGGRDNQSPLFFFLFGQGRWGGYTRPEETRVR